MSLSCDEARVVFPIAWGLPPDRTVDFVRAVEAVLAGHPVRGEGLAYRTACEILPRFFIPPFIPERKVPEHYNVRKPWLRRCA
jgi:hypothetical protein